MTTIELRQIRNGAGGWELVRKVDGNIVKVERYSAYANAKNRAEWFRRMDWRVRIVEIR